MLIEVWETVTSNPTGLSLVSTVCSYSVAQWTSTVKFTGFLHLAEIQQE